MQPLEEARHASHELAEYFATTDYGHAANLLPAVRIHWRLPAHHATRVGADECPSYVCVECLALWPCPEAQQ